MTLRTGDFIADVLDVYRGHVGLYWNAEGVDQIETDHRDLLKAYNHEPTTKALIDGHDLNINLNEAWGSPGKRLMFLRNFSGGIAVAFANTTSVESDFTVLK